MDETEHEWRKTTNLKTNLNSKLKNKIKEQKRNIKQAGDLLVDAQLELKNFQQLKRTTPIKLVEEKEKI